MAETEKQEKKRKRRKLLARKGHSYQKPSVSRKEVTEALNLFLPADRPLYRGSSSWMKTDPGPSQGELFPEENAG